MRRKRQTLTSRHISDVTTRERQRKAPKSMGMQLIHEGDLFLPPATAPIGTNGINKRGFVLHRGGELLGKETFV